MSKRDEQLKRLANVNEFITIIASMGRRFFNYTPDEGLERCAWMYIGKHGHVYLVDEYTETHIYTHYRGFWRDFSNGGTLQRLVVLFKDHIKRGVQLHSGYFDTNEMWCSNHPWGYPEQCYPKLRSAAIRLGIMATPTN